MLVEYGRRQALGIIVAEVAEPPAGVDPKPIADRVRADGPLLPPLSLALARWIASHYLAPAALVMRAMLPPKMLERLELVAERTPLTGGDRDLTAADEDLLEQLASGPRATRDLASPEGRAGLVRRLRALATRGLVSLDWTLTAAAAGPRFERWIRLTDDGRATISVIGEGGKPAGRPLGPRQLAALEELAGLPAEGAPSHRTRGPARVRGHRRARPARAARDRGPGAPAAAAGHSASRATRRAPARYGPPARAGRGAGDDPGGDARRRRDATPARWRDRRGQDRDLRRCHRGGARGRAARADAGARDRHGPPARRSDPCRPRGPRGPHPLRAGRRGAGRRVAPNPRRGRRHRRGDAPRGPCAAAPISDWSSWTRSTKPRTRATGHPDSRRATRRWSSAGWPARRWCWDPRRPRSRPSVTRARVGIGAWSCPAGRWASSRASRSSTCARNSPPANGASSRARCAARARPALDAGGRRRRPSSS